jgi:hypothetical protein
VRVIIKEDAPILHDVIVLVGMPPTMWSWT